MHMTAPRRRLPPRAEHIRLRGRSTDLERPEEWERQDLEPRVLFCLFLHSNELLDTDSHRELSRLPHPLSRSCALTRSGRLLFAICIANLRQPNDARYCEL
jgi:hypothetical protein